MSPVATVNGTDIFFREAGDPSSQSIVLLHGFPSSSYSFRDLIPLLADRFHVLAPDYPGFGYSPAPALTVVRPTFDDVARIMDAFVAQRTTGPVILYMHDFGGPIGMRIATAHPDRIAGLILQNAVIATEAWRPGALERYEAFGGPETPEKLAAAEQSATISRDIFLHRTGAREPDALDPDKWAIDAYAFSIPESRTFMARMLMNIPANVPYYPEWSAYLEKQRPKTLIVWGRNDPLMLPARMPAAQVRLFDGGHFVLDEYVNEVAEVILETYR